MFLWMSSNSCPVNKLLVQSHQAENNHRDQGAGGTKIMQSESL